MSVAPIGSDADDTDFTDSYNDMPVLILDAGSAGRACVARQGAQLLSWRDSSGRERLYLSPTSGGATRRDRANAEPIRGGVPVCFPQFSGRGTLPKHGLVRTMAWSRADADVRAGHAVTLQCCDDAHSRQIWPHGFTAALTVTLADDCLTLALSVHNSSALAWEFTAALHTYFRVDDICNVRLLGLQGASYQDATADNRCCTQQERALQVTAALDRVYVAAPQVLQLQESGVRSLQIEQHGFSDSVVWNPGPLQALPDLPADDWQHMLCVEAACVVTPVRLLPGQRWNGSQILRCLAD